MNSQVSLDDYVRGGEYVGEASMTSIETGKCGFCRLWGKWFKLHPGAIYLYVRDGEIRVSADMDYVYKNCRKGLRDNIRFLYRMFKDFKASGYDVVIVGKAYDDDLKAYIRDEIGRIMTRYNGLNVWIVSGFSDIKGFEERIHYMKDVDGDVISEAISIFREGSDIVSKSSPQST